jgi:hypothetical protein
MDCKSVESLPEDHDWQYEIKFDGYRAIALKQHGEVQLFSRRGNSLTEAYPEIAFLNRQTQMTLKYMSEFPYPIRGLFIAPQNMSRVFDADNMWLTESRGGLFCCGPAFMGVAPIGGRGGAVRCGANKSYRPVPARPADELHLPAAKSLAATATTALIVQRFPSAATVQPA